MIVSNMNIIKDPRKKCHFLQSLWCLIQGAEGWGGGGGEILICRAYSGDIIFVHKNNKKLIQRATLSGNWAKNNWVNFEWPFTRATLFSQDIFFVYFWWIAAVIKNNMATVRFLGTAKFNHCKKNSTNKNSYFYNNNFTQKNIKRFVIKCFLRFV